MPMKRTRSKLADYVYLVAALGWMGMIAIILGDPGPTFVKWVAAIYLVSSSVLHYLTTSKPEGER